MSLTSTEIVQTPICGVCFDGLCGDHPRDCAFGGFVPCACPNNKEYVVSGPITIQATPVEPIEVSLVGKDYLIIPPKAALAMRMAVEAKLYEDDPGKMAQAIDVWMRKAFGDKYDKVQKRLDDESDPLDVPHIMELMEKVIEAQTEPDPTS